MQANTEIDVEGLRRARDWAQQWRLLRQFSADLFGESSYSMGGSQDGGHRRPRSESFFRGKNRLSWSLSWPHEKPFSLKKKGNEGGRPEAPLSASYTS